ncbi:MAG: hypothetical protein QOH31_1849 [Verrucomicrobiota bacterium]|jgi:hypothetical protein
MYEGNYDFADLRRGLILDVDSAKHPQNCDQRQRTPL